MSKKATTNVCMMNMDFSRVICICTILCFIINIILFDIFEVAVSYIYSAINVKYGKLLWLRSDDNYITNRSSSVPSRSTPSNNFYTNSNQYPTLTSDDIPIHTFTAISKINLTTNGYDSILVNVWHRRRSTKYQCCFRTKQNFYFQRPAIFRQFYPNYSKVYECDLLGSDEMPFEVALLNTESSYLCRDVKNYTKIVYPRRHINGLALCVKAAYGYLEPRDLVAWIEFHLIVGVDKIFFLVNKIDNKEAMDILQYYSKKGLLQIVDFKFHLKVTEETKAGYQRLSTFDCQERIRGYTYAGLLDIDEYIVPQKLQNIKEIIKMKRQKNNRTAGVTFLANYFFKSWKAKKPSSRIDALYYFQTTVPLVVRIKSIHIPERTKFMSVNLHLYKELPGYRRIFINPNEAAVHHYRECPNDHRFGDCTNITRHVNKRMLYFEKKLAYQVFKSLKEIQYYSNNNT